MYRFDYRWLVCLAGSFVLAGCGGSDSDRPETVSATGTVTFHGQPVEGATVTFVAESAEGRGAVATTDESGHFELTTFEPGDGAIVGNYQVKISKTVPEGALSQEEADAYAERGQAPPPIRAKEFLPTMYKDPTNSGLAAEVEEDGDNEFEFNLTE